MLPLTLLLLAPANDDILVADFEGKDYGLVDRGSIEVFGNDGRVALSVGFTPAEDNTSLALLPQEKSVTVEALSVSRLKSSWSK